MTDVTMFKLGLVLFALGFILAVVGFPIIGPLTLALGCFLAGDGAAVHQGKRPLIFRPRRTD